MTNGKVYNFFQKFFKHGSNIILGIVIVFVAHRLTTTHNANSKLEGKKLKDFSILEMSGRSVLMSSIVTPPAIFVYWHSSCAPCVVELMRFNRSIRNGTMDGKKFFTINLGERPGDIKMMMKKKEWNFNVLFDYKGEASRAIELKATPTILHLKKDFNIDLVSSGIGVLSITRAEKFLKNSVSE